MLSRCFLDCSVGVGFFVTGLSQISSIFSSRLSSVFSFVSVSFVFSYLNFYPKVYVYNTKYEFMNKPVYDKRGLMTQ